MNDQKFFDVSVNIRIRVRAKDQNAAENHVLDLLDTHLAEMLESAAVVETGVPLPPTNPTSAEVV